MASPVSDKTKSTQLSPAEVSHRRLLEALRASPASFSEQDEDLRYVTVLNLFPPWKPEDLLGKTSYDILPPDEAERLMSIKREVMATGQGTRICLTHKDGDRTIEYCQVIEPRYDDAGKINGVTCISWDVTRERAIERALQNSHMQLCLLVSDSPTSIAMLDREFRYIAASRPWMREWGRGHAEIIGKKHYEIWPECPPEWRERLRLALQEGKYFNKEEDLYVLRDGTSHWSRWAVYPWRDALGQIGGIILSIDDISERKRAEQALKESEERFRVMAETVPDSLFITRADGYSEYTNEQYCKITGLEPDATRGSGWAEAVHPDDRERILCSWQTAVQTGEPYEERLRLVNQQTGASRWYVARALPMRDAEGHIVRWFGCTTDIEDQVREAALREADRRKNEFLAMLSHELRNPLAAIRSAVYLLQNVPPGEQAALKAQAVIDRQVSHLTRIVDDLLDIARISRGKFQLDKRCLDFGEVLRRTVEDHRPEFDKRNIELECWLGAKESWVEGDETRLIQLIDNLLGNAVKFTPRGGRVEVFLKNENNTAVLKVKDSGIGIPPERLADLFEPFMQIESTIERGRGGLGLGLALVKGIVDMHGGSVQAASPGLGQGAQLTVLLPISKRADGAMEPRKHGIVRGRRVLLIEDNIDMAELLRQLLIVLGQDVHVVHDGRAGIEAVQRMRPDLVICDIGLPEMNGHEVARILRADPTFGSIDLVALSGYGLPEDRKKSTDAGFSKHLVKPVSMEDIEQLLADD